MGIAIEDIQQGIRDNSIHGQLWGGDAPPAWEGQVLSELALLTAGEELVYVEVHWWGDQEQAKGQFLAITESLVIASEIPDTHLANHTTTVLPRSSLSRMKIAAAGIYSVDGGPVRVRLGLEFDGLKDPVEIPGRGQTNFYSSTDIGALVAGFRTDLNS